MQVDFLSDAHAEEYEVFLQQGEASLVYASPVYRRLLRDLLAAEDLYLLARDASGEIVGALPAFFFEHPGGCHVLNSLPFFGSNGGVIEHRGEAETRDLLLGAFDELARARGCMATTVITSPFEKGLEAYRSRGKGGEDLLVDERIGQLTRLPTGVPDPGERLLASFDPVRRRNIRRAERAGVVVEQIHAPDAFGFLERVHREGMSRIQGRVKPSRFFELVPALMTPGEDFRLYVASHEGKRIAALLLFAFHRVVEYFVPATLDSHRTLQPMALIVFRAMVEASQEGYHWWNWGGTWTSQRGVYDFKKRWGTVDRPYHYFSRVYDRGLLRRSADELAAEYPYFFTVPYGALED